MIKWQILAVLAVGLGIYCLWRFIVIFKETDKKDRRKVVYIYIAILILSIGAFAGLKYSGVSSVFGIPDQYSDTAPEYDLEEIIK